MRYGLRTLLILVAWSSATLAQPSAAAPPAKIGDAAWLAGRWVGEGLGGTVEETWAPPGGGQMFGHFRLVRDGKPVFYELMLLDEHQGGLRLRVKHFNPDFTGWEEKDGWHSFEPESVGANSLRFKGLWLRLEGGEMVATVTIRNRTDNSVRDETLRHRRSPL